MKKILIKRLKAGLIGGNGHKKILLSLKKQLGKTINAYTDAEGLARNIQMAEQLDVLYERYGGLQTVCRLMEESLDRTKEFSLKSDERKKVRKVGA
jgi:uncharacterized protein YlaN (UPF0358 family)